MVLKVSAVSSLLLPTSSLLHGSPTFVCPFGLFQMGLAIVNDAALSVYGQAFV